MNKKLILQLSLFGLGMSIATVFWIPSNIEPAFWLVIFIICAYFIAVYCPGKYFLHGFLVSLVNCVWVTAAHIIFYPIYIANHASEAAMMANMPIPDHPRLMMLMMGPVVGIVSGLLLGFLAFLAARIMSKK